VAKALLNNTTTTELDFGFGANIQDKDLAPLLELLKTNTTLREIRLDGNDNVSDGMKQRSRLPCSATATSLLLAAVVLRPAATASKVLAVCASCGSTTTSSARRLGARCWPCSRSTQLW
jgi:hypothetical protein